MADLNVLQSQDTLLLSDSLVLSRYFLSRGSPLLEQLWQRLTPRANAESSPAARRLADDAKRVASKLPLSFVRPMAWRRRVGRSGVGSSSRWIAWRCSWIRRRASRGCLWDAMLLGKGYVGVFDPIAGGGALLVIDVGSNVRALAVFKDRARRLRLACGCSSGGMMCASSTRSPVAGRCL